MKQAIDCCTHADAMTSHGFTTSNAGGILGGNHDVLPCGDPVAFKPTPSISLPMETIDHAGAPTIVRTTGRHDPCVGIRAVPVVEASMCFVAGGPCPPGPCQVRLARSPCCATDLAREMA
ncbi:chorismate synthase [Bradyrhizobium sp. CCBAU 11361]|uniref:chorismate synthase n=1 Tax=Bradyrhizobium sp. CCBAU 11361 TaxID=1630812 RepID=UPI003FA4C802